MTKRRIAFLVVSVSMMMLLLSAGLFGQAVQKDSVYRYLSLFTEVFSLVRSNYVEPVAGEQLVEGAFSGVTSAVDEFSYYVPPEQMAGFKRYEKVATRDGIGLVVSKRFGYLFVIGLVPGSAAEKAGVEAGDFIEKVNGRTTDKMPVWQAREAFAAADGKPVRLTVVHSGMTKRRDVTVTPAAVPPVAVESSSHGAVGYVKIPYFGEGTAKGAAAALTAVRNEGKKKLIVDVRGNPGGSFEEAVRTADLLLSSGRITATSGRRVDPRTWSADRETAFDGEVIVLTDQFTAGAAEVFSAAISGNKRGRSVGLTTYGSSIIQRFVTLPSGGGLHLTIGHYTTPDAKPITDSGVKPDVVVELASYSLNGADEKADLILEKALSLFEEKSERIAA